MDRWATKDRYEVETEESERLVRPAPKVKPPRHDRRRETLDPDRDPDIDGDPDIAGDKDVSLNYKNVGGSLSQRVLARHLGYDPLTVVVAKRFQADIVPKTERKEEGASGGDDWVSVIKKDTGEQTRVKKDTLKGPEGSKYKVVKEEEVNKPKKDEAFFADARRKIDDMATHDEEFSTIIKGLSDPNSDLSHLADAAPTTRAAPFMRGRTLPEGVETLGDLKKALAVRSQKKPEKKPGKKPVAPSKPTTPSNRPPFGVEPHGEEEKALRSFVEEGGHEKPEFKNWAKKIKTISEAKDGTPLFLNRSKERVPFDKLDSNEQLGIKEQFEKDVKNERAGKDLKGVAEQDPKIRGVLRELANENSDLRREISRELTDAKMGGKDLSHYDIGKTIPQLAGVEFPPSISNVQELLDATDKAFAPPPEPKRPKASKEERIRAQDAITETFPEDVAQSIMDMDLHPEDVNTLVSDYRAALAHPQNGKPSDIAKRLGAGYSTDPESIEPPDKVGGKKFDELSPDEQAEAFAKHKMRALAASFAAKKQVADAFADSLPAPVAREIASAMLQSGGKDIGDHEVEHFYRKSLEDAANHPRMSDADVKHLLRTAGDNPAARKLAVAYMQARDYAEAREQFLAPGAKHQISEWHDPAKIAKGIERASKFLADRAQRYPREASVQDTAMDFRNRVMDRIKYLTPEKAPMVRSYLKDVEMNDYEHKAKAYEDAQKDYDKAVEKEEMEGGGKGYRHPSTPTEDALQQKGIRPPKKPSKPPGYDLWKDQEEAEKRGKSVWDWFKNYFKAPKHPAPTVEQRTAARILVPSLRQRVAFRHLLGVSSYSGQWSMGQPSPDHVRTAVYWGVEPYPQGQEGFAPYQDWSQLHARDFGDVDARALLSAAREWLRVPVLGREIAGLYRDTQLRAALDLAIRDLDNGKYSVGLHPTVYNDLLAKLAGDAGPYELLTGKPEDVPVAGVKLAQGPQAEIKSTYGDTPREVHTMKASAAIRSFAARAAAKDPELGYDLLALANKLATEETQGASAIQAEQGQEQGQGQQGQQEQQKQAAIKAAAVNQNKFNVLRSLVIRQAAQNPDARAAFTPILQALKG